MTTDQFKHDADRAQRTGLAEAIFCAGKSEKQLHGICETLVTTNSPMLFTRLSLEKYESMEQAFPGLIKYDKVSKTGWIQPQALTDEFTVGVITGGSSDVPVAAEAIRTLNFYGVATTEIHDVGVAGLWRLMERVDEINSLPVVICIAGMDAALPTVLGGLVSSSLIAVPTSVGYGMTRGGETALNSLLVSCAPGLTVVNIDNGYGAACAALRILNQLRKFRETSGR